MAQASMPTNDALREAFSEYRSEPRRRFHVKIRRERAQQLRELLSDPGAIDLKTFNSDVWVLSSGIYFHGEKIGFAELDDSDREKLARYERALEAGELELHGNLIWSPPTQIYGAMLGVDDEQRTENVRDALRFLIDGKLSPPQKARRIETVPGFGPATATGLTMIFHPDEFALYNKQSRGAMKELGRDETTPEAFEQEAADLKETLGAEDYLELDHFLLHINQGWIEVSGTGGPDDGGDHGTTDHPLNLILYGPPGTGKTFSVRREAVRILAPDSAASPSEEISELYRDFGAKGRIEFVTFHPSYSYEEFVEGFRYDEDAKIPKLHNGVFKDLARQAAGSKTGFSTTREPRIWKVTLGRASEQHLFERCMENYEITVGWVPEHNLTGFDRQDIEELFKSVYDEDKDFNSVDYLVNGIRSGDYVVVFRNQSEIRAIGKVTGEYQYRADSYGHEHPHARPVEWLDRGVHNILGMNGGKKLPRAAIRPLDRISVDELETLLPEQTNPYVLVIDEINRGNISRVFGELITLLEEDKRLGAPNEMKARLPYSKEEFAVPSNLYVVGTMNTADRSIALLDVALRRRFAFREMMPDVEVVRESLSAAIEADPETDLAGEDVGLICEVFEEMNRRIRVLVDRDHQIGHSYFMEVSSAKRLRELLYGKIFPLLQEYFYNDQRRLKLLLGVCDPDVPKGFVVSLDGEYRRVYGEAPLEDEAPWEFHEYADHQLVDALRNTFAPAG